MTSGKVGEQKRKLSYGNVQEENDDKVDDLKASGLCKVKHILTMSIKQRKKGGSSTAQAKKNSCS